MKCINIFRAQKRARPCPVTGHNDHLNFILFLGEAQEDTTELGSNYGIPPIHTHFSLHSYLQALYTQLIVLIFDGRGKSENLEKNHRGMRSNNTSNKLSSHMTQAGIEPRYVSIFISHGGTVTTNDNFEVALIYYNIYCINK